MKVKVSIDGAGYSRKPVQGEIVKINQRIANNSRELDVKEIADMVGNKGHTFCPAVFSKGKRRKENFLQMQLFGLDFDTGVSFEQVKGIAKEYGLSIAFAYQTFSSTKDNLRFRIVFVHDVPVTDSHAAEIMLKMLLTIFPNADRSCKDVSCMFFGGKGLVTEINEEAINIVHLSREFHRKIFEQEPKNYSRSIRQFAKDNHIVCENNVLQIMCISALDEFDGKIDSDPYRYRSNTVFPSKLLI